MSEHRDNQCRKATQRSDSRCMHNGPKWASQVANQKRLAGGRRAGRCIFGCLLAPVSPLGGSLKVGIGDGARDKWETSGDRRQVGQSPNKESLPFQSGWVQACCREGNEAAMLPG